MEKKIFMTITRKWIFILKGTLCHHWLSCHPALLKAFKPFSGMPRKSIAIYSLFGPQARKVNNTVTSSLPAEHGHKTALPLKYNLMQLFIYAGTLTVLAFIGDKYFSKATQRGQALAPEPGSILRPVFKKRVYIHLGSLLQEHVFYGRKIRTFILQDY